MIIVGMTDNNIAIIYELEKDAQQDGIPYSLFEEIPEGNGVLKTDLKKLWRENLVADIVNKPKKEELPSEQEQLRADVDYIAAMTGVELV